MSKELDIARRCAARMYEADASSKALGISIEVTGVGQAEARVEVTPEMINGFAVCHGGHIFALAGSKLRCCFSRPARPRIIWKGNRTGNI